MRRLQICLSLILVTTCLGQSGNVNLKPLPGMQFTNRTHRLSRGLVAYWPMNERSGPTVFDLSGNGIVGPLGGNVAWTAGLFGSALDFPGASADAIEPGKKVFDCSKPFAVSVWINPDTSGAQDTIFAIYTGSSTGILLRRDANTTLDLWLSNAITQLTLTVNNGSWYHMVVTYNGTDTYAYINAILDPATPVTRNLNAPAVYNFQIGKSSLGNYDGQLDNLIIWQRYLSASEIAELYRKRDSWMFKRGDIELMAKSVAAPPPAGGQFIMIQMSAIPLVFIVAFCFVMGRKNV